MSVVAITGSSTSPTFGDADDLSFLREDYAAPVSQLLPNGPAWSRDPDTKLMAIARAIGYGFSRVARRALNLLDEAYPPLLQEMITDWESVFGIVPGTSDLPTRRAAIIAAILGFDDPTNASFLSVLNTLGYTDAAIFTHKPFFVGDRVGHTIRDQHWRFRFDIVAHTRGTIADAAMKARINRRVPNHTAVGFIDPYRVWTTDLPAKPTTTVMMRNGVYLPERNGIPSGYVFVGYTGVSGAIAFFTSDGLTFTPLFNSAGNLWGTGVATDGNGTVVVASDNAMYTSVNGGSFTITQSGVGVPFAAVVWNGAMFVVVSTSGIWTSPDGVTWTAKASSLTNGNDIAWNAFTQQFVYTGTGNGNVWYTADFVTKTAKTDPNSGGMVQLAVDPITGDVWGIRGSTITTQALSYFKNGASAGVPKTPIAGVTGYNAVYFDQYGHMLLLTTGSGGTQVYSSQDKVNFYLRATLTSVPVITAGFTQAYPRFFGDTRGNIFLTTNPNNTNGHYHLATYRGFENLF